MSSKESTLIIGSVGQVGRALFMAMKSKYNVYRFDVRTVDNGKDKKLEFKDGPDIASGLVTHICIPFSDDFHNIVKNYYEAYKPIVMIIHSSVAPGTTKKLLDDGVKAVHSPTFFDERYFQTLPAWRKPIGWDNEEYALIAAEHMTKYLNCVPVKGTLNTELGDICLGLYYSSCVGICQELWTIFTAMGGDYSVMTGLIDEHNLGNLSLKKDRELLLNPLDYSKILKDYRIENLNLLPENLKSPYFKLTVKSNELFRKRMEAANG